MWRFIEENGHDRITLHDCLSDDIRVEGNDLIVNFPDGFWVLPYCGYHDDDLALKTGPAQVVFKNVYVYPIDLFYTTRLFRWPILCRRVQVELPQLLKKVNDGKHQLEFLWDYHRPGNSLYQCWLRKKNYSQVAECQFEIQGGTIEYRWNEILPERKW